MIDLSDYLSVRHIYCGREGSGENAKNQQHYLEDGSHLGRMLDTPVVLLGVETVRRREQCWRPGAVVVRRRLEFTITSLNQLQVE